MTPKLEDLVVIASRPYTPPATPRSKDSERVAAVSTRAPQRNSHRPREIAIGFERSCTKPSSRASCIGATTHPGAQGLFGRIDRAQRRVGAVGGTARDSSPHAASASASAPRVSAARVGAAAQLRTDRAGHFMGDPACARRTAASPRRALGGGISKHYNEQRERGEEAT